MATPEEHALTVEELVASARVPWDEQVEEQAGPRPEHDDSAGHLPGNVRPYGA